MKWLHFYFPMMVIIQSVMMQESYSALAWIENDRSQ